MSEYCSEVHVHVFQQVYRRLTIGRKICFQKEWLRQELNRVKGMNLDLKVELDKIDVCIPE